MKDAELFTLAYPHLDEAGRAYVIADQVNEAGMALTGVVDALSIVAVRSTGEIEEITTRSLG